MRRVVTAARAEARRLGHNYVGTEHLPDEGVRRRTLRFIGRGDACPGQKLRLTARTVVALRYARRAAWRRGSLRVRERDVLAGLVREGSGAAAIVLSGRDSELLADD